MHQVLAQVCHHTAWVVFVPPPPCQNQALLTHTSAFDPSAFDHAVTALSACCWHGPTTSLTVSSPSVMANAQMAVPSHRFDDGAQTKAHPDVCRRRAATFKDRAKMRDATVDRTHNTTCACNNTTTILPGQVTTLCKCGYYPTKQLKGAHNTRSSANAALATICSELHKGNHF